jgi:outer membrane protein
MAVANWNFWEWGKTKYRVDMSKSKENQIMDTLVNAKDQITLEVKSAYLLLREAEKQIFVSKRAIEQAEENFRITQERYREQVATSTDVLDAQTLLTRAKSDHTNALGDYHISHARLERAMGMDQGSGNRELKEGLR